MGLLDIIGKMKRRARMRVLSVVHRGRATVTRKTLQVTGVQQFVWRSKGDNRVRPLHRKLNGLIYDLSTGHPTEGFPGDPYGCRCIMKAFKIPQLAIRGLKRYRPSP